VGIRVGAIAMFVAAFIACTSPAPPATPSGTAPGADLGPPPTIPTTDGATLTLTNTGVAPKQVRVYLGSRLTFTNTDASSHEIASNPLHVHTDCPQLNAIGFLVPGQSRTTSAPDTVRACGFHDHTNEGDARFYGTVFVDPR
jgi:hypothetical protein